MEGFYKDGLRFSCNQCSDCCRKTEGAVFLEQKDIESLSRFCEVTPEQFILIYCRWLENDAGESFLTLRETSNLDCIFWENGGCKVYPHRPIQCSTYPFWSSVLKDKESWEKEKSRCPGINEGELHDKKEIEENLAQYKARKIIKK